MVERWRELAVRTVAIILWLLATASIAKGLMNAFALDGCKDFQWDAARVLLLGQNPYTLFLSRAPVAVNSVMPDGFAPNQFPSALMLLWPYALFSWPIAKILWIISNVAFTIGLLALAFRRFLPGRSFETYAIIASLVLISLPWRNVIGVGQHIIFSLFFFMSGVEASERKRPIMAGLLLAISLFKYTTTFALLPYLAYRRQWIPLVVAFAAHGVLTLVAAAWVGEWPHTLILQSLEVGRSSLANEGYLDLFALTIRAGLKITLIVPIMAGLLFLASTYLAVTRPEAEPLTVLSLLALVSGVIIYHRGYDFLVLIFPLLWLAKRWDTDALWTPLLSLCILSTWYVDRIVYGPGGYRHPLENAYVWSVAAVWYMAILYGMLKLQSIICDRPRRAGCLIPDPLYFQSD